jgi:hypothetical protein
MAAKGEPALDRVWNFFLFAKGAITAYRMAKNHGSAYLGITRYGIPQMCIFVGRGREAWRISRKAVEEYELRGREGR